MTLPTIINLAAKSHMRLKLFKRRLQGQYYWLDKNGILMCSRKSVELKAIDILADDWEWF